MKQKQAKAGNRQIFSWLMRIALGILGLVMILTSCQAFKGVKAEDGAKTDEITGAQKDAYEAKIVYYESQIQNLSTQLTDMEQQIYVMRDDYLKELSRLEQEIANKETEKEPTPSDDIPTDEDTPATTDKADTTGGETSDEDAEQTVDIKLCDYTYRLEDNHAILTQYHGNEKDVVVPAAVDGYLVTGLGDSVFADCDVRSVTLPQTVETLGWFTFYQCKNLEKVVLPDGIDNIGYASFDGCASTLCLFVDDGSYAQQYAISFGLNYQT